MTSTTGLRIHNIREIKATFGQSEGTSWIEFMLTDEFGGQHEVTAFVERPLEIEGAEFINLMAAHEKEAESGSLVPLLKASIEAAKARKEATQS